MGVKHFDSSRLRGWTLDQRRLVWLCALCLDVSSERFTLSSTNRTYKLLLFTLCPFVKVSRLIYSILLHCWLLSLQLLVLYWANRGDFVARVPLLRRSVVMLSNTGKYGALTE